MTSRTTLLTALLAAFGAATACLFDNGRVADSPFVETESVARVDRAIEARQVTAPASRKPVADAGPATIDQVGHPNEWSNERRAAIAKRIQDRPTATLVHALRVRAAGARQGGATLRELQADLVLRLATDAGARAETEQLLETGRAGRASAAWVRGALVRVRAAR